MKSGSPRIHVLLIVALGIISAFGALRVYADALVGVTASGLDPDPVYIFAGDVVYWTDAGGGLNGIYFSGLSTVTDGAGIQFLQTGSYGYFDDNGDQGTVVVLSYTPPTVNITAPANNAILAAPATFDFSADPSSAIGISDVEFYVGTNLVDDVFGSPFTTTVTHLPAGAYSLMAIAYDNDGDPVTASISITVGSGPTNIVPVACGDIYSSGNVVTSAYLSTGGNIHGGLEFAAFNASLYAPIQLALNPYGLPMYSPSIYVYGFDGGTGALAGSNYNSGTLLGVMTFPANVNYGQVVTFDVTRFVQSVKGQYFGFILQDDGGSGDVLSSLGQNYGTPPELISYPTTLPPALVATQLGNQMVIAWNTNNATGLSLQSTTDLTSGSWTPVTITPTPTGGQLVVTNPISGPRRFFRLSNH
jgi:hypothetical protein